MVDLFGTEETLNIRIGAHACLKVFALPRLCGISLSDFIGRFPQHPAPISATIAMCSLNAKSPI